MSLALVGAACGLVALVFCYVCLRRGRHGGLAGGDPRELAPHGVAERGTGRTFTVEEVESHNSANDLWLIINGGVYDFTDYIALHPGGEAILRNAGKDSTKGFSSSHHPQRVWDMILEFHIGDVVDPDDVGDGTVAGAGGGVDFGKKDD